MDLEDLIRSGKIKRFFRATRKLNVPQLVLHVTQRAAGKEPLFLEDADYLYLVWLLKEISTSHHLKIYAFCLMPNHLHLLFSTEEPNLYDAMRDLFARYATRFNRKYGRRGHLFGGPYRQAICLDDSYLIAASLYLHLNPVRANLADDPQVYRWSSCRLYCDSRAKKLSATYRGVAGASFENDCLTMVGRFHPGWVGRLGGQPIGWQVRSHGYPQ